MSVLPWWLGDKAPNCNAGDLGSIPGSGRSPGGGNDNQLQYSCQENPKDRRAWGLQSMGSNLALDRIEHATCIHVLCYSSTLDQSIWGKVFHYVKSPTLESGNGLKSGSATNNGLAPGWLFNLL